MRRPELLRFVVHRKHWRSGERSGLFQAMGDILGGERSSEHLRPAFLEMSAWFNENLKGPFRDEFSRRQQATWKIEPQARSISWIKISATEHVTKLYHLKALIEEAGWIVDELRTTKPGVILYEDECQVIATP